MPSSLKFSVVASKRAHPIHVVGPDDFECINESEIPTADVLDDPSWTLYCFDPPRQEVVFVRVSDLHEVENAPFYYQAQVEHATEVARVPAEDFLSYCGDLPPNDAGMVLLHNVGRCGSTLLSKAFQAVPGIRSISEPDELTQLARLRAAGDIDESEAERLLGAACRFRSRGSMQVVLKFRAEVCPLWQLVANELPAAKHLFMYRNGVDWMRSIYMGWRDFTLVDEEFNRRMEEGWSQSVPLIAELRDPERPKNPVQIRMLSWISSMESYFGLLSSGVPLAALRYEDLNQAAEETLRKVFDFCETPSPDWIRIREVLAKDSQAGTMFDREERRRTGQEMPDELIAIVEEIVASRPLLRTPEVILPGTL